MDESENVYESVFGASVVRVSYYEVLFVNVNSTAYDLV